MNFQQPGSVQQGLFARFLRRVALLLLLQRSAERVHGPHSRSRPIPGGTATAISSSNSSAVIPVGFFGPDAAGAESLTHDPKSQRLFVVNVANATIDVVDIKNPTNPKFLFAIDLTPFGSNANSVAVDKGIVAVAVQANVKTDPGMAVFFDAHGTLLNAVEVGALPDMITFTPDGEKVLVANEGEPNRRIHRRSGRFGEHHRHLSRHPTTAPERRRHRRLQEVQQRQIGSEHQNLRS